jgi:hypothetical protein
MDEIYNDLAWVRTRINEARERITQVLVLADKGTERELDAEDTFVLGDVIAKLIDAGIALDSLDLFTSYNKSGDEALITNPLTRIVFVNKPNTLELDCVVFVRQGDDRVYRRDSKRLGELLILMNDDGRWEMEIEMMDDGRTFYRFDVEER